MKNQIIASIITVGFVVLLAVAAASAQVNNQVAAEIPFDFYVKNQKFAAGEYIVERATRDSLSGNLIFRRKDGSTGKILLLLPSATKEKSIEEPPSLIFNRYGADYFLAEFRNPADDFAARAPQVKLERNLAKQHGEAKRETIVMNSVQRR